MNDDLALFDIHGNAKRCTVCRELKPLSAFHKNRKSRSGLKHYCISCSRKALREWQIKNAEHVREYRKRYWESNPEYRERRRSAERKKYHDDPLKARDDRLRYKYGITLDEYREMEARQGAVCAICQKPCKTGRDLAVDHNHATGAVRALLCGKCNKGIGLFDEDPDRMLDAISYLLSYQNVLPEGGAVCTPQISSPAT